MPVNISNLPSRVPRIYGFRDNQLDIKFLFPTGYDLSDVSAKLFYGDKYRTGLVSITVVDNLVTATLTREDFLSINLPVFEFFLYISNTARIGATIELQNKPGTPVSQSFDVTLIDGQVINVDIIDATVSEANAQLAIQAAIEATQANEEAQAIVPTLQTDISSRVPKTTTVNGKALTANISLNKTDIGLNLVDNTPDNSKPISTLQQVGLDLRIPLTQKGVPNGVATYEQLEIKVSRFATINQATLQSVIASVGSNPTTIILDRTIAITSNMTIPNNIDIQKVGNSGFDISTGITLTNNDINQNSYPDSQIYFGTGNVTSDFIVPGGIKAAWFGAIGDFNRYTLLGTDNYTPIQRSINFCISSNSSSLYLPQGILYVSTSSPRKLIPNGAKISIIGNNTKIYCKLSNASDTFKVFYFGNTTNKIISLNGNIEARYNKVSGQLSSLPIDNISDFNYINVGDIIEFTTLVSSINADRNGKIWNYEYSVIDQKTEISKVYIPAPVMPVYGIDTVIADSTDTLKTTTKVFKAIYVDLYDVEFITDYSAANATGSVACLYTEQAVVNISKCNLIAFPEDTIPSESGVEYGLKRRLLFSQFGRDNVVKNCYLEKYGYGIWFQNGYNHSVINIKGKGGRHLITSHGVTHLSETNVQCSTGGAIDAHGGCGDWTLINVCAENSTNPTSAVPGLDGDMNNMRIWSGNVRIDNCSLNATWVGSQTASYITALFDLALSDAYCELMYNQRVASSSLSVSNSTIKEISTHGRFTKLNNSNINKILVSDQSMPRVGGTSGGLPAFIEIDGCYNSKGQPLLAASSHESGDRNVIISSKKPSGQSLFKTAGTVLNTYGTTNDVLETAVTLTRNTIFVILSPDQILANVSLISPFARAIDTSVPRYFTQSFNCVIPIANLSMSSLPLTIVFLLGNYGIGSTVAKIKANLNFELASSSNSAFLLNRDWVEDSVKFDIGHNLNVKPTRLIKDFNIPKSDSSGNVITLETVRTFNRTTNSGNLIIGYPKELQGFASADQCALLARGGFEMDITLSNTGTLPVLKSMLIKGEITSLLST